MLKWMKLKNLALVEEAEIEFKPGFTVITGETGAGKSVIMGGIGLLLGERADKSAIRTGADKCEISGEFQLKEPLHPELKKLLDDNELLSQDNPDTLWVRRVITPSSTKNFVNAIPVTLQLLHSLGKFLVDIHAANENQSLLNPQEQLAALDRFAQLAPLQQANLLAWQELQQCRKKQAEFLQSMPSEKEIGIFRRELDEIRRASPVPGEDDELKKKHELASHSRRIIEITYGVSSALTEEEHSLFDRIAAIRRFLMELERIDPEHAQNFLDQLEQISESVQELSSNLQDHGANMELDDAEFQAMEERMRMLQSLKRRYGPALESVLEYANEIEEKIDCFESAAQIRTDLLQQEETLHGKLKACAGKLSQARKEAALTLTDLLSQETRKLGFLKAEFQIEFDNDEEPGPNGQDRIQILFTANPGVPMRPLKDVASSGEIARIMLAAKTVLAEADSIPILIFDEIDANIGGETAGKVGKELQKLAQCKQVICISHSPMVASCGVQHFLVSKNSDGQNTRSAIAALSAQERVNEIARMLGSGDAAQKHAAALLQQMDQIS